MFWFISRFDQRWSISFHLILFGDRQMILQSLEKFLLTISLRWTPRLNSVCRSGAVKLCVTYGTNSILLMKTDLKLDPNSTVNFCFKFRTFQVAFVQFRWTKLLSVLSATSTEIFRPKIIAELYGVKFTWFLSSSGLIAWLKNFEIGLAEIVGPINFIQINHNLNPEKKLCQSPAANSCQNKCTFKATILFKIWASS